MAKQKYIHRTINRKTDELIDEQTSTVQAVSTNIFSDLKVLSHLMPEVIGAFKYESKRPAKEPRFHGDLHELLFIVRGKGTFQINNKYYPVAARDVVVLKPKDLHRYTKGSRFECITFHYSLKNLEEVRPKLKGGGAKKVEDEFLLFLTEHFPKIHKVSLVEGSQVINKVIHLFQEYEKPGAGSRFLVSLYFLEILVLLSRNYLYAKKGDVLNTIQVSARDEIMVRQIVKYLDENFRQPVSHEDLFKNYYLHPNYCRNIFKKITGKAVSEYVLMKRMEEAKHLVVDSDHTLTEIAEQVGVEDYYYFLRVFKKYHGVSPGSLRKNPSR